MAAMNPGFRQDIQGLRALAVLLVILDHARIGPFHGGFIGVDVFFVISGFLITGLLVSEAERTGRASLLGFYARRARRILPAATLVILATVAASVYFLSAVEANGAIEDALWATFFAANFKFARDGTDYFQNDTPPSPLQHYWSLSVEEQFYLVWPLLVLLLCLYAAWRARRSAGARSLGPRVRDLGVSPLVVIVGVSFAYSVSFSTTDPVSAYFSPFTRAWELGFGALVACLSTRLILLKPSVQALLSWAGLAAVVVAALVFDATTVFPGYAAAVPVVGTAALLAGGLRAASWGPQWLLSVRPMRLVGDWSYSLYLWHWPVLIIVSRGVAAGRGLARGAGDRRRGAALGGDLLLRGEPVPEGAGLPGAPAARRPALPGGRHPDPAVAGRGQQRRGERAHRRRAADHRRGVRGTEAARSRTRSWRWCRPRSRRPRTASTSRPTSSRRCSTSAPTSPTWASASTSRSTSDRPLCPRGDTDGDKTLVLIGDSHARQWVPALDALSKRYGYTAYFLIREGCPSSDVTPWMVHGGPSTDCEAFQEWARQQVEELQPDVVLLGSEANRRGFTDDDGAARERRSDDGDDVPRGHGAARSTTCRRTPAGSS